MSARAPRAQVPPGPPGPADVVTYYSQFFNVVAELFPGLTDLHYGLTPPAEAGGPWHRMWGRLRRGPTRLLERVADLGALAALPKDSVGVDIGCGLGGTCLHLASRHGFPMIGVNLNAAQLRLARPRVARHPAGGRVTLLAGDARALPLASGAATFATLIEVAFHVPDKARLFAEVARVLPPGGRLILVDQEGEAEIEALGLFWFAAEGAYRRLAAVAGLECRLEQDLSEEVAAWMADYARTASLPFHAAAVLAALGRARPGLAWRYLRGVRFFSDLVRADFARRGASVRFQHPFAGVQLLRQHTRRELASGRMRYKAFVFEKAPGKDGSA